ncbi:MAG: class A beta-lactamase-related serine hydrolase, partial [Paramuribaculum sp.]|nr:class A beta-lactamase-related serine hydrolase [Paramuribaculum sp.]
MNRIKLWLLMVVTALTVLSCSRADKYASLRNELEQFVADKDARIGVAVIVDGKDTVSVNGEEMFPMLSVYKFPIALALAEYYRGEGLTFDNNIPIHKEDLHLDTYSPMTEKILSSSCLVVDSMVMPARDLLRYMLELSDNNASDIVFNAVGRDFITNYISKLGEGEIKVVNTESEMHGDRDLCYDNSSTPIAIAALFDKFNREFNDSLSLELKEIIENCATGTNRLAKPLEESGVVTGHKTGTGFIKEDGRIMAVNDAGYVNLPDGHRYS